jgi:hypothetical protein
MVGLRRADAAGKTGRWSQAARHPKTKPRTGSNHGAGFSFSGLFGRAAQHTEFFSPLYFCICENFSIFLIFQGGMRSAYMRFETHPHRRKPPVELAEACFLPHAPAGQPRELPG